jgi:hypothetical protein
MPSSQDHYSISKEFNDIIPILNEWAAEEGGTNNRVLKSRNICLAIRFYMQHLKGVELAELNGGFSMPTEQLVGQAIQQIDKDTDIRLEEEQERKRLEEAERQRVLEEERRRQQEQELLEQQQQMEEELTQRILHGDIAQTAEELRMSSADIIKLRLYSPSPKDAAAAIAKERVGTKTRVPLMRAAKASSCL